MSPRTVARSFALVLLCLVGCSEAERPPNVLFILADDLRWDTLGSYGNDVVQTPNLDRLAKEGVSFDAFYVANPVCSASRANFLTGRHSHQPGIERQLQAEIPPEQVEEISEIPPKSTVSKLIPWLIPGIVIALFIGGFFFGTPEKFAEAASKSGRPGAGMLHCAKSASDSSSVTALPKA